MEKYKVVEARRDCKQFEELYTVDLVDLPNCKVGALRCGVCRSYEAKPSKGQLG